MRTLLRNRVTGFYFQGVADWTKDVAIAYDFRAPERAARFVAAARLNARELELILAFNDPRYNVPLPIDERYGVRGLAREKANAQGLDGSWPAVAVLSSQRGVEAEPRFVPLDP